MATYFASVTSPSAYKRKRDQASSITGLRSLHGESTSQWSTTQLITCRAIVTALKDTQRLPVLAAHYDNDKLAKMFVECLEPPGFHNGPAPPNLERGMAEIFKLCRGPPTLQARYASEHQYLWADNDLGQVWAALARLRTLPEERGAHREVDVPDGEAEATDGAGDDSNSTNAGSSTEDDESGGSALINPQTPPNVTSKRPASSTLPLREPRLRSGRVSNPSLPPGFVNSTDMEDILTLHFISSFIRCALPWVPPQGKPNPDMAVVLDQAPFLLKVDSLGDISFASQDDGSLRIYQNGTLKGRIALFEAKRSIGSVEDAVSISDDLLGQLVGEALAARLQENYWVDLSDTIITITGARRFLRFVQFEISDEYVDQLKKHAADDASPFTEYIRISATRLFDLSDRKDRYAVIEHLAAIAKLARLLVVGPTEDDSDE